MIDDVKKFLHTPSPDPTGKTPRKHPTGWEPGVDTSTGTITIVSDNDSPPNEWAQILREFALDPDKWQVASDTVQVRTWDSAIGAGETRRFFYFRADVRPRQANDVDLTDLMRLISRHRFKTPEPRPDADALIVCLSDWQTGGSKPDRFVEHMLATKNRITEHLKTVKPARLYVVGMGDMVEGCDGHYAMQTYQTAASGLNGRRDQVKLVRRLLTSLLQEWARNVPELVVGCVPGNHGENRRDGKAFTTFEDNDDVAVFEQVADIFAANPDAYGHVRFVIPDGDMTLTLDVGGTIIAFAHGHQARRGAGPQAKLLNWWKDKAHARHPVGDADILVSGHYHHLQIMQDGAKTWFQCPAVADSRWWEESGGATTKWGTLTFKCHAFGWDDLKIL